VRSPLLANLFFNSSRQTPGFAGGLNEGLTYAAVVLCEGA
jgi:hypothetical protein